MIDVRDWLAEQGLEQYAEVFAENAIDEEILRTLSDGDLKELGVTALGHRKKLLAAIALLSDEPTRPSAGRRKPVVEPANVAERRQLTVMFVDLVGSTELSGRLDPEDLREVLRAYQQTCGEIIEHFEGHVAKYIGDGLLVYFGYPQAHEDDARRAVSAGLGIVAGIRELNRRLVVSAGVELGVRVGIHTGLVVAGEMGSGETRETGAIVGKTPNIAARLESLAGPNTVVISAATQRLVEGLFECDDLGPQRLKGVGEPVTVFRARGESDAPSRFEASARRGLTPLVGRGSEIDLLLSRWAQAKEGEAQAVLLSGEAGVGKSRIVRAMRERLNEEDHNRILYYGSPFHRNSALHPVIEQMQRAFKFEASDGADEKLNKLERTLATLSLPIAELAPLLAALLSLPAKDRYPTIEASPQLLRRKTLEALLAVIEAMATVRPVLTVVEDAHWADPSTLELLSLVIERLRSTRLLLLVSCRPEFEPTWTGEPQSTVLRLNRLSRRESADLILKITGGKRLPEQVIERIVERTDGVALFVEEMTKAVLESSLLSEHANEYVIEGPMAPFAIPASLHDSLMARLDRMAPVKEVAQLAATLGRTFSFELLAAVSSMDGRVLEDALHQLESAELLYRRGVAPDITYDFKHALVQDVAYQSILKRRRQEQHARIAQVLVEQFRDVAVSEPEVVAHHYTEAGLAGDAADQWLRAGRHAMQRSANIEAERHLEKGLEVLRTMPEGSERRRREIALQNTLGVCLMPTRGFGNPDVAEAFSRAASVSEEEGDARGLFVALRGKGQYQMISGDLRTAREQATQILGLAHELNDPGVLIEAHHLGWSALTFTGDFEAARSHAETGVALYDRERDHGLTYVYSGHDPGVCCRSFGSLALWQLGYPEQALTKCLDGERLARDVAHPFSVTIALWAKGMLHLLRRETDDLFETGEAMIAHCSEKGFPPFIPMGRIFHGGARAERGEPAIGLSELAEGLEGVQTSGTRYTLPLFFAWLAELCGRAGRVEDGWAALRKGLAMAEDTGDGFSLPEFHRIQSQLLLVGSGRNKAEAEACIERALGMAHGRGARGLELRAATSLARLRGEQGRRNEARERLGPICGWFTEGFQTPDLLDAKRLLDELA